MKGKKFLCKRRYLSLFVISLLLFVSCDTGGNGGNGSDTQDSLTPQLQMLSPASKAAHMPAFNLGATGSNFVSESKIVFNGIEKSVIYVSSKEIVCEITPDDTSTLTALSQSTSAFSDEINDVKVPVFVRNPSNEGGDSNSMDFTIKSNPEFKSVKHICKNQMISRTPEIAVDNYYKHVYVTWFEQLGEVSEVYFRASSDYGDTWRAKINISKNTTASWYPCISVDHSGNVYVAWDDWVHNYPEMYVRRSSDAGSTWSKRVRVPGEDWNSWSDMAIDSVGNIHLVWHGSSWNKNPKDQVSLSSSYDNGSSWCPCVRVCGVLKTSGLYVAPKIAVGGDDSIYVVWHAYTPDNTEIYLRYSRDGGTNWSATRNLSNNTGNSDYPAVCTGKNGNICHVWSDDTPGKRDIFFRMSKDNGQTWGTKKNITKSEGESYVPRIAIDKLGNINVVWTDISEGAGANIFYCRSIDQGKSWSPSIKLPEDPGGWSASPDIVVDGNCRIYVAWMNTGLGEYNIYFSRTE